MHVRAYVLTLLDLARDLNERDHGVRRLIQEAQRFQRGGETAAWWYV